MTEEPQEERTRDYDIDLDGERFLIVKREGGEEAQVQPRFDVVLNWHEELMERLAAR